MRDRFCSVFVQPGYQVRESNRESKALKNRTFNLCALLLGGVQCARILLASAHRTEDLPHVLKVRQHLGMKK